MLARRQTIEAIVKKFKSTSIEPAEVNPFLLAKSTNEIKQKVKIATLMLRPQVNLLELKEASGAVQHILDAFDGATAELLESVEILIKYEGYIIKERELAQKFEKYEKLILKDDFDYQKLQSLSYEAREKLSKIRPHTLGQAARISGISPSDISVLAIFLSK